MSKKLKQYYRFRNIDSLLDKYEELEKQGRYKEAIKYAEKLIPAGEKAYAESLNRLASDLANETIPRNALQARQHLICCIGCARRL